MQDRAAKLDGGDHEQSISVVARAQYFRGGDEPGHGERSFSVVAALGAMGDLP